MAKTRRRRRRRRRRCGAHMFPKKGYFRFLFVKSLLLRFKKKIKPVIKSAAAGKQQQQQQQICEVVLIQKILMRLPVESLLRFKSVCKSWCSLIESSSFIDLHTTTTFNSSSSSSSSNKFGSFIIVSLVDKQRSSKPPCITSTTEYSLIMLSPESDDDDHHQLGLQLKFDSLGVPQCYQVSYFKRIVGSCNGLICLFDGDVHRFSIWNPATKQHRILPKPIPIDVHPSRYIYAFGFDLKAKDYKVVLITAFPQQYYRSVSPIDCVCRIQVYSLSTDSWRLLEGITCLPGDPFQGPMEVQYVNGSCFFMVGFFRTKHHQPCIHHNDRFIIKFDLTKEIITPFQLPDHHRGQELFLSCLGDDKIALFIVNYQLGSSRFYHPPPVYCDDYYIWALLIENNNSSSSLNKDSWTKLHSFQIEAKPDERNIPRGISNDGKFAFLELNDSSGSKRMKLYHFASKQVIKIFPPCGSMMSKADAYRPSLVSIIGGGNGACSY